MLAAAANAAKTHCPQGHAYDGDNLHLRPDGKRRCRTCVDAQNKARYANPELADSAETKPDDPLTCSVCGALFDLSEFTTEDLDTMRANPAVVLCEACGESIPFDRLKAESWAARCVPCQQKAESRGER